MVQKVHDIYWINDIDPKRILVAPEPITKTHRHKILYKYNDDKEPSDFYIATPNAPEGHVLVKPIAKNVFQGQEVQGYNACIVFDQTNPYHNDFLSKLDILLPVLKKHNPKVFMSAIPNGTTVAVYVKLMCKGSDEIITPFYTKDAVINDPLEITGFKGRVAFGFSLDDTGSIWIQLIQAYVHEIVPMFPLVIKD
jgi:hypothetical protein